MQYKENIGEALILQMTVAKVVENYSIGKDLPKKMTETLKKLLFENMKEDATDEAMADLLEEECENRRLDPEAVMKHFGAISENLQSLLSEQ